jgi:WD40 repeat protein
MAAIFLSYSRADAAAVKELQSRLVELGHEVWRDEGNLPEASLWREEITNAIERSDVFLLAVSRQSLSSREVRLEFEHARNLHKRIVPVVIDNVSPAAAPPDLADINWIHLNGERSLERIDRAIKTDLHHVQQHTRFLLSAREWERNGSAALRGANLREAEAWLAAAPGKEPEPAELHRKLIGASLKAEKTRRIALIVSALLLVLAVGGLLVVGRTSRENQRRSVANRLAGESLALWKAKNYDEAMLRAVAAYQAAPTSSATRALLNAADEQPQLAAVLHGHHQEVDAIAFDPRGGRLVSAGGDPDGIHIYDTTSWKALGTMGPQPQRISQLLFADDGSFLVAGDWDGIIRRWDATARSPIGQPLIMRRGLVESLALHPGRRFLAAAYSNGAVLWDLAAVPPSATELPVTQSRRINAVAFADDGATLVAVEGTEKVVSWSFSAGVLSDRHEATLGRPVSALATHESTIVAGLNDGTLVWLQGRELREERRMTSHQGTYILSLAFDQKGERLASASSDGNVRIWHQDRDEALPAFESQARVRVVAFDPRSSRLALSGTDPAIHVLDLDIRQPLAEVIHRIAASIQEVSFADGDRSVVATTLDNRRLKIDIASRRSEHLPDLPDEEDVTAMAEGNGVRVKGYKDGHVVVLRDMASTTLPGAKLSWIMTLLFSPDGKLLLAGDNGGRVVAWETATWKVCGAWQAGAAAASLAFSSDGNQIAAVDAGTSRIILIDPRKNATAAFDGNCKRAFSVAFSRDGSTLVTGCDDGSLELLDVSTRERIGSLPDLEDPAEPDFVNALARNASGDRFVAGTEDGRIMLWRLDPALWMRRACRRANRDLTDPIPGWNGSPLLPCSALLKNAPSDDRKPDAEREEGRPPRIPSNVAELGRTMGLPGVELVSGALGLLW